MKITAAGIIIIRQNNIPSNKENDSNDYESSDNGSFYTMYYGLVKGQTLD